MFKENNLHPEFVESYSAAIEAIDKNDYDFIFSGYSLPDGNGVDIGRHLREMGVSRPGIVLLTTEDKESIVKEALAAGITRILFRSSTHELQTFIKELADSDMNFEELSGKVLLIDDDRTMTELMMAVMKNIGFECDVRRSGEQALTLFAEQEFDLIVADYFLEGEMNGLDVVNLVRQMGGKKSRVPIIVISGQADRDKRLEILKSGANDYIDKPIIPEELQVRAYNMLVQKKLFDRVEGQRLDLQKMAMTDSLTGLYNRHFLSDIAPKRMAEARRHETDLTLMVIDIDHFKAVNDTHGHDKGDEVLRSFASLLKQSCRQEDIAIRLGGEEFLLILPHCSKPGATEKAEKLRKDAMRLCPGGVAVTISIGVACVEHELLSAAKQENRFEIEFGDIFSAADQAVYKAKNAGRNRVEFLPLDNK